MTTIIIDWIRVVHEEPHPLTIDRVETGPNEVRFHVRNHRDTAVDFTANGQQFSLAGQKTAVVATPLQTTQPLQAASVELTAAGLPPVRRTVFVHLPSAQTEWVVRQGEGSTVRVARNGRVARIERDGELLAILGPLVHCGGRLPALTLTREEPTLRWEGEGVAVELQTAGREVLVSLQSSQRCTGPVVRVMGGLEQALLAGLEYLGKGEASSTTLDVETDEHLRFVTGKVREWQQQKSREVQGILRRQQADGSFRYNGPFRRGHFEDTASGVCARPAAELLEHAWLTGDRTSLEAGLRTLEFMKRIRTPRGAQVWEVPLHTSDQLASASLVWAYVRGFEPTGRREYLQAARKWALSGVPFVYQWCCHPIMAYGTPPVFGSTHWRGTCWIGRPVQWVGGVYAYALTKLAPYDDSLDWNYLARGILIAAEQMQYPDGPFAGLLPDAFELASQSRVPARINPCALVSLRLVLDGKLDGLAVAADERHRVVAPYPIVLRDGKAHIAGRPGTRYQILVDGQRIIDVASQGDDVVEVE